MNALRGPLVGLVSLAVAALLAEAGYRALGPPLERERGRIVYPDGREVPIADVLAEFAGGPGEAGSPPRVSRMPPNGRFAICYEGAPRPWFDSDGCVPVTLNRHGLRDDEFPLAKPDGEYRVLAVGDSFTFGLGVRDDDAWPQVLESLLAERRGGPVQVVNAGFAGGYKPSERYAAWLPEAGLRLEPDCVVVAVCLNDLGPVPMLAVRPPRPEPWLGGASHLLTAIQRRRAAAARAALPRARYADFLELQPEPFERFSEALLSIRDTLAEREVRLVVAVLPMLSELADYEPYRGLHALVADLCAGAGIECVDLSGPFVGRTDERALWVHPTDQHPGPEGHRLFAEQLVEPIAR